MIKLDRLMTYPDLNTFFSAQNTPSLMNRL